jgi:hypothetical protein
MSVNTTVNAEVVTYSILSLIQGKEWKLLDMFWNHIFEILQIR